MVAIRWILLRKVLFIRILCRVPVGTRSDASDLHRTAPMACTVLFISHPFGVIYRITSIARVPQW